MRFGPGPLPLHCPTINFRFVGDSTRDKSPGSKRALSCPKGGLVIAQHNDAAKEWDALGSRALVPSAITYKPKINSRTVQGERTGAGAWQEVGEADGGM